MFCFLHISFKALKYGKKFHQIKKFHHITFFCEFHFHCDFLSAIFVSRNAIAMPLEAQVAPSFSTSLARLKYHLMLYI